MANLQQSSDVLRYFSLDQNHVFTMDVFDDGLHMQLSAFIEPSSGPLDFQGIQFKCQDLPVGVTIAPSDYIPHYLFFFQLLNLLTQHETQTQVETEFPPSLSD